MLKTILIAVAQLAIIYGGPVVLRYVFGWSYQERMDVAWYAFGVTILLGYLLGLPSLARSIVGAMAPLVSIVVFWIACILVQEWSGTDEPDLFYKHFEMFIGLFTTIWILVPCGLWYIFGRHEKDKSFVD